MTQQTIPIRLFTCILFLIAMSILSWPNRIQADDEYGSIRLLKEPLPTSDFTLEDVHQHPFTQAHLKNKWSLVYFGYLSCSDACPSTLSALRGVFKLLEAQQPDPSIQVVFVSVDPHRDTLDRIKEHLQFFNTKFIGITGAREQLDQFLTNFGGRFEYIDRKTRKKIPDVTERAKDDDYIVGHWVDLLLINPQGELVGIITPPHDPKLIVKALHQLKAVPERH